MRFGCLVLAMGMMAPAGSEARAAVAVVHTEQPGEAKAKDAYVLAPEVEEKAEHYSRARLALEVAGEGWGIVALLLILTLGVAYRMKNVAVNLTRNRWTQAAIFVFELLTVMAVLDLPLGLMGHHLSLEYGQSVQGWGSWLGDRAKTFVLAWGIGTMIAMGLMQSIRRSPKRWWLPFWMGAVVFTVAGVFISPYVIDPLFNRFQPLQASNPALVARLEQVVARGGIKIPPERMFLMQASAKVTGLNAYVTGFGASKRVVVWDTTVARADPDEIAFVFGHEMGHYCLNHIVLGVAFAAGLMLVGFYVGFRVVNWLIRRYGGLWRVGSAQNWGALVVMLLVFSAGNALVEPVGNAFSRWEEHQADVYGQEAVHGLVADPQGTGVRLFQLLGETSLAEPHPNRLVVLWTYTHPSIEDRAVFARDYDPWAGGGAGKYFRK